MVSVQEIADQQGLAYSFLAKILPTLVKHNLLVHKRGQVEAFHWLGLRAK